MASLQAKVMMQVMKLSAYGWAKGSIAQQRARQEKLSVIFKLPAGIAATSLSAGGVPAELLQSNQATDKIILYLHGGAYTLGSVKVHREFLARLARVCSAKVLAINYRLAPENPFPAALEDSLMAYQWVLSQGYAPSNIVIAGDSAGGGLAIATLISLRDRRIPLPSRAVCLSPWLDLSRPPEKYRNCSDPILNPEILGKYAHYYTGNENTGNPLISPVFADLQGLPPILIHAGTNEILLDQISEFYEKALKENVEVAREYWQELFHVFQIVPVLPESAESLEKIREFINSNSRV